MNTSIIFPTIITYLLIALIVGVVPILLMKNFMFFLIWLGKAFVEAIKD